MYPKLVRFKNVFSDSNKRTAGVLGQMYSYLIHEHQLINLAKERQQKIAKLVDEEVLREGN